MILSFVYFNKGNAMSQTLEKPRDEQHRQKGYKITKPETKKEHAEISHLLGEIKNIKKQVIDVTTAKFKVQI